MILLRVVENFIADFCLFLIKNGSAFAFLCDLFPFMFFTW